MWEQIASGNILDATQMAGYDDYLDEGQRGQLEISLRVTPPAWIVSELQDRLDNAGVENAHVSTGSPLLRISYRKGFPWLAVIVAAVLALAVLAVLVIAWRFYREVVEDLGPTGGYLFIAAVLGVAALGAMALRRVT